MKNFTVDRFEGNYVVVEYGNETINFPRDIFDIPVNEGDVLDIVIRVNKELTESRKKRIDSLARKLFKD